MPSVLSFLTFFSDSPPPCYATIATSSFSRLKAKNVRQRVIAQTWIPGEKLLKIATKLPAYALVRCQGSPIRRFDTCNVRIRGTAKFLCSNSTAIFVAAADIL